MSRLTPSLTALGLGVIVVLGLNVAAYAVTGQPLLMGQHNRTGNTTKLETTGDGPALSLKVAHRSDAPLAVTGTGKVRRLNADQVDGLDATQLGPVAAGYVDSNGELLHSRGVASSGWDAVSRKYSLVLTDVSYVTGSYATVVTPVCTGVLARTGSSSGSLLVELYDLEAAGPSQCGFGFVVYSLA